MEYFSTHDIDKFHDQTFAYLLIDESENVLRITLNREGKRNALHPQMINELAYTFQYAHAKKNIWIVVIQALGKVFCAGADLKAFAGIIEPHNSSIPVIKEPILIAELFNKLHKPTIAKITGDVYAGGFFFLAGANIVIAQNNVKFGLPEVKRGLYPFQVMAALMEVMPTRKVVDWCIRGYNLSVQEAEQFGLVTQITSPADIHQVVDEVIAELKLNSPTAVQNGLKALDYLRKKGEEHKYLHEMLINTIESKDGQEGLKAFREKRLPLWSGE